MMKKATEKQLRFLKVHKIPRDKSKISIGEAGRLIGEYKNKHKEALDAMIREDNVPVEYQGPASYRVVMFLKSKLKDTIPYGITKYEAILLMEKYGLDENEAENFIIKNGSKNTIPNIEPKDKKSIENIFNEGKDKDRNHNGIILRKRSKLRFKIGEMTND